MTTFEKALAIAKKDAKGFVVSECIDIGDKYVFFFDTADGDIQPGAPIVCVAKKDYAITHMTIPPLKNLDLLKRGKQVEL